MKFGILWVCLLSGSIVTCEVPRQARCEKMKIPKRSRDSYHLPLPPQGNAWSWSMFTQNYDCKDQYTIKSINVVVLAVVFPITLMLY